MSGIYRVQWNQSGCFGLAAVVVANTAEQAVDAVGYMHSPTDIRADRIGTLDPTCGLSVGEVVAQESI